MKTLYIVLVASLGLSGCASREYVREYMQTELAPVKQRADAQDSRLAGAESELKAQAGKQQQTDNLLAEVQVTVRVHADRMAKNEADMVQLSTTAQEAVERASEAGKLAQGKLTYEVVLSDDKLKFAPDRAELSGVGQAELDELVARLKQENKGVFIEIQGHTDSIGEAAMNLRLGEARAQAVKRYLNINGGVPLHHMSTISYGESEPIADNHFKAGREKNRRVVMVVIQ